MVLVKCSLYLFLFVLTCLFLKSFFVLVRCQTCKMYKGHAFAMFWFFSEKIPKSFFWGKFSPHFRLWFQFGSILKLVFKIFIGYVQQTCHHLMLNLMIANDATSEIWKNNSLLPYVIPNGPTYCLPQAGFVFSFFFSSILLFWKFGQIFQNFSNCFEFFLNSKKIIITARKLPKKKTLAPLVLLFFFFFFVCMGSSNGNAILSRESANVLKLLSWECIKFWNLFFLQWANQWDPSPKWSFELWMHTPVLPPPPPPPPQNPKFKTRDTKMMQECRTFYIKKIGVNFGAS